MPVPWSSKRHRAYIDQIAERPLTVKKLNDLRTFLKRLCKARILHGPGTQSHLTWHCINLYDVTDAVIKPVIYFREQERKVSPGQAMTFWKSVLCGVDPASPASVRTPTGFKGFSWAELVNTAPLRPQIMVSHWWGGRFSDFMKAIDNVVDDRALSINATIWICTFANNQFGENLGDSIMETPFVKAIEFAEATILMVDRDAGSLRRSWCCLELHYTIKLERNFELYTSAGLVGSAAVSSGPLVDAVSAWDVRDSQASEMAYRRQILNFIAGEPEKHGLQTIDGTADGKLLLIDGRPQLDEYQDRFSEEQALLTNHRRAFEDLNMDVRVSVIGRIGLTKKPKGCLLPDLCQRGMSLGQLRTFARKAKAVLGRSLPDVPWEKMAVWQLCQDFIIPETAKRNCSYAELVVDGPQLPDFFVDYQFNMYFADIMSSIEWFAEAMKLKDSAIFFFNLFGFNQNPEVLSSEMRRCYFVEGRLSLDQAQLECQGVLLTTGDNVVEYGTEQIQPWNMSRAWRCYTIECASRLGQDIYVGCPTGVMACTRLFPNGHSKVGSMSRHVAQAMFDVDIENSACAREPDRRSILAFIQDGCGGEGIGRLQRRIQRWAAFHLASELAASGDKDLDKLSEVCSLRGFSVNAELAKGILGESTLHDAVAARSYATVWRLLDECTPDPTDAMHETPLHYAALAGDSRMVQLLLEGRADPYMESVFGETPLDVARDGAAAFLGYDSSVAQKERRRATIAGERIARVDCPETPNFGSERANLPANPEVLEGEAAEISEAQQGQREIETFDTGASSSSAHPLSGAVDPNLRPRPNPHSSPVHIAPTRILIVSDFHGVLDTPEFLKYYGSRREETLGEVPLVNRQAVHRLLQSDRIQLAVLSYIGAFSREKRLKTTNAIRELNAYLSDKGCEKRVGISICDQASDKAGIVERARAAAFVDDKLKTCQQTVSQSRASVFFVADRPSRDRSILHVRSFSEFVDCVLGARFVPVEDSPPWLAQFPIP
eukprot:Skav224123  [mRNA]  locus=scaffold2427:317724:322270:- [translate_table: standard]